MLCPCSVRVMGEVRSYPWLNACSDLENCNSFAMYKKKIPVETSLSQCIFFLCFFVMLVHNNMQGLAEQIWYKTRTVKNKTKNIFP